MVVIFCVTANPRYPEAPPIPETVPINSRITSHSPERISNWEGCLSVPGLVPLWGQIRWIATWAVDR